MLMLKICHACEAILGEIESENLTLNESHSIMDIVGNVAYALCPECAKQLELEPGKRLH